MKKLIDFLSDFLNSLAQARAATALANLRHYEEAAKIMQKK